MKPLLQWAFDRAMRLRWDRAFPHIQGRLLDVGCGSNGLSQFHRTRHHSPAYGMDAHPWPGLDIVGDGQCFPFQDSSFDTVSFIACLNHIPDRQAALAESWRVLRPGGRVVLTMIGPLVGVVAHTIFHPVDEARHRHTAHGELPGLSHTAILNLLTEARFTSPQTHSFALGLNRVYVAHKPSL